MSVSSIDSTNKTDWLKSLLQELSDAQSASGTSSSTDTASTSETTGSDTSSFASSIVSALDTDGDGKLSAEELDAVAQQAQSLLSSLDDSTSQTRAFEATQQEPPPPPPDAMASDAVSSLDADGDGSLSETETGLSDTEFSALDTNGDGSVSTDELTAAFAAAAPQPPPHSEPMDLSALTTDKDSSDTELISETDASGASNSDTSSEYANLLAMLGMDKMNSSNLTSLFGKSDANAA